MSCINPWPNLVNATPYWLGSDTPQLAAFNRKYPPPSPHSIVDNIFPEPFIGTLPDSGNRQLILLNLNPGYAGASAHTSAMANPRFRTASLANLNHQPGVGFFLLDFPGLPGFTWWSGKLRQLILKYGINKVKNSVFCLEWFGYSSQKFHSAYWKNHVLPSQEYTYCLLNNWLNNLANEGHVIIVMRGNRLWELRVPSLVTCSPNKIRLRNPQNVSVSPGNMEAQEWDIVCDVVNGASDKPTLYEGEA